MRVRDSGLLRVLPVLFLGAGLPFVRQLLFGAGLLDDDVFDQNLPAWEWLSHALRSGDSILWTPNMLGGFPIAFTQYPYLYPPDLLLAWLLPPAQAYAWSQVLHLLLAGVFTYLYCRFLGIGAWASLLAAASFEMGTEVVGGMSGFAARGMFSLPASLLGVEWLLRHGWPRGPMLALVVAVALLVGHPQLAVMILVTAAAYGLWRWLRDIRFRPASASARAAGWLIASFALGAALAAVRLLPQAEIASLSTRAAGLPSQVTAGGLTIQGLLVGNLLPLTRLQTVPWGAADYVGPAAIALVLLGLRGLAARPHGRFFLGLALLTALLSMGDATPVHYLTRLPLLSYFREPARFGLLTGFALSVMAGMALEDFGVSLKALRPPRSSILTATLLVGLGTALLFAAGALFQFGSGPLADGLRHWSEDHFLAPLNPLRPRMAMSLLGLLVVLLCLALAAIGRLPSRSLGPALTAVTFSVLLVTAVILNPPISAEVLQRPPQALRFLDSRTDQYRVFSPTPGIFLYNLMKEYGPSPEDAFSDDFRYRYLVELLAPVLNLRWGISSMDGFGNFYSIHQEAVLRYIMSQQISGWLTDGGQWARLSLDDRLRVLEALNVRYLLSPYDMTTGSNNLKLVARWQVDSGPQLKVSPSIFLIEDTAALPRYYLVPNGRSVAGDSLSGDVDTLYRIAKGEVDPASVVLLNGENITVPATSSTPSAGPREAGKGSVELVSSHNAEVVLRVSTTRPQYLVTSDAYWPGWKAFVDGKETPIWRANAAGRAVWLAEPGDHDVVFRFEPFPFQVGLVLSLVSALVWAFWLIRISTYPRKRRENQ